MTHRGRGTLWMAHLRQPLRAGAGLRHGDSRDPLHERGITRLAAHGKVFAPTPGDIAICTRWTPSPYPLRHHGGSFSAYCTNPGMTPKERNNAWLELEAQYQPHISLEGMPYLDKGTRWRMPDHIYETPFYYIDYCLARRRPSIPARFFENGLSGRLPALYAPFAPGRREGLDGAARRKRASPPSSRAPSRSSRARSRVC